MRISKIFFGLLVCTLLIGATLFQSSCKKDKDDDDNQIVVTLPTVTTTVISDIIHTPTHCDAKCGGNVTSAGGGTITARGVCYGLNPNPTINGDFSTDGSTGTGAYTCNIGPLQPATDYFIRAYATNSAGTAYGNEISFNTGSIYPVLTTVAPSIVTNSSAFSGGYITSDGGQTITERGVCWSIMPNPTIASSKVVDDSTGTGTFMCQLTGLTQSTWYNIRAYAINGNGVSYGNQILFQTVAPAPPIVTTTPPTQITQTTATTGGNIVSDGGYPVSSRGICWSNSPNPTTTDNVLPAAWGAVSFVTNMSNLTHSTAYYIRAYATNQIGTSYGNEYNFTTTAPTLPVLTTIAVTDIRGTHATSGGIITSDGGAPVTARGLCWSTSPNPTTANTITLDGSSIGNYTSTIANLSINSTYYVRAYATNSLGTAYGNQITINSGYTYGTNHEGGLVFYNDGNGGGLVCAPSEQSTGAPWGCSGIYLSASGSAIGTGEANTNAIVNGCSTQGIAAEICLNLSLNSYSDWFLPSIVELALMNTNLHSNGLGGFTQTVYWSSTEEGNNSAKVRNFYWWNDQGYNKTDNAYVRAVRNF